MTLLVTLISIYIFTYILLSFIYYLIIERFYDFSDKNHVFYITLIVNFAWPIYLPLALPIILIICISFIIFRIFEIVGGVLSKLARVIADSVYD